MTEALLGVTNVDILNCTPVFASAVSGDFGGASCTTFPNTVAGATFPNILVRHSDDIVGGDNLTVEMNINDTNFYALTPTNSLNVYKTEGFTMPNATLAKIAVYIKATGAFTGTRHLNIDFVFIEKSTGLELNADKKMRDFNITRTDGTQFGSAYVNVQDEGGLYWPGGNEPVGLADVLLVYASVDGSNPKTKLFGGPIWDLSKNSKTGYRVTTLQAVGWETALQGTLILAVYGGQDDDLAIIQTSTSPPSIIEKINTGQNVPSISGWSLAPDNTNVYPLNVNALVSIMNWGQISAQRALLDLSEYTSVAVAGGVGTNFAITPSECLKYFPTNNSSGYTDQNFSDTLPSNDFIELNLDSHSYDIRTAVTILGNFEHPRDGDTLTENDAANWTATTCAISDNATTPQIGAKSIRMLMTAGTGANTTCFALRALGQTLDFTKIGSQYAKPTLNFYFRVGSDVVVTGTTEPTVTLTNVGGGTGSWLLPKATAKWQLMSIPIGSNAPGVETGLVEGSWVFTAGFGWSDINKIQFSFNNTGVAGANDWMDFDGLYFAGFAGRTAVDTRAGKGDQQYGRRELVLMSQVPLQMSGTPGFKELAHAELLKWRDPIIEGDIIFDSAAGLALSPLQRVNVTSAQYGFTAKQFRVKSVNYQWDGKTSGGVIKTTARITDFMANALSRSPQDVLANMSQYGGLSRVDKVLQDYRSQVAYLGITPIVDTYST